MYNLDILILTSIVSTLFIVFMITVYREIKSATDLKQLKDGGPRASMVNFIGNMISNENLSQNEKELVYKTIKRTISDMESDGTYFSDNVRQELEKKRDELYCEYSNLPSVKSYEA